MDSQSSFHKILKSRFIATILEFYNLNEIIIQFYSKVINTVCDILLARETSEFH